MVQRSVNVCHLSRMLDGCALGVRFYGYSSPCGGCGQAHDGHIWSKSVCVLHKDNSITSSQKIRKLLFYHNIDNILSIT